MDARRNAYERSTASDDERRHRDEGAQSSRTERLLPGLPQEARPVVSRIDSYKKGQNEQQLTGSDMEYETGGTSVMGKCLARPIRSLRLLTETERSAPMDGDQGLTSQRGFPGAYPQEILRQAEERVPCQHDRDRYPHERSGKQGESLFTKTKNAFKQMAENHRDYEPYYPPPDETKTEKYRRQREEARDQLDLANDRIRELENYRKQDAAAIRQYIRQLELQSSTTEEHKKAVDAMQEHMDNKELYLGRQLIDNEIKLEYNQILKEITNWSLGFNAGTDNDSMFREERIQEYRIVAPMCSSTRDVVNLVSDKTDKRLFVRGWVAYVMTKRFFRALDVGSLRERDLWVDGTLSAASKQLEDAFWSAGRLGYLRTPRTC
jgi:F0F1-type ATP synthase gamma subunit